MAVAPEQLSVADGGRGISEANGCGAGEECAGGGDTDAGHPFGSSVACSSLHTAGR